ncbi:MAG: DMT family transporter [Erysipelotrichaceae bacterium]|nr:DMT family transporter [Erysipelotrichaceae bacterium]
MSLYYRLLLASLFWGSNVIVMKILLNDISFLMLALLRVWISLLCLSVYMLYKHISFHYQYHLKGLLIGILGIYLNFVLTFMGMSEVSGQNNALMNALAPVVTFILSVLLLHHKAYKYDYIALILAILAFLISIQFDFSKINLGFIYLFLGMIMYMLSNVCIQRFQLKHCFQLIFYELLYGFIFLMIHSYIIDSFEMHSIVNLSLFHWLLLIIISGAGFAFIQITYMHSINEIGAYKTSFYLSLNPLVTYIESIIFLQESIDVVHLLSFMAILVSIYLIHIHAHNIT